MRAYRTYASSLLLLTLGCVSEGPEAPAQAGQALEPSTLTRDALLRALGGQETVAGLTSLRVVSQGARYLPHEGVNASDPPRLANNFNRTLTADLTGDLWRIDTSRDIQFLFPGPESFTDIVRGNLGTTTQLRFGQPLNVLSSDKLAAIRVQELLLNPALLFKAFDSAGFAPGPARADGLSSLVVRGSAPEVTLVVDPSSGALVKLETMEHDFYRRDVAVEVYYTDWQQSPGGLGYARNVRLVRDGQFLVNLDITEVETNPSMVAGSFDFPAGVQPTFDQALYDRGQLSPQWYFLLDSIGLPFSGIDRAITATPLTQEMAPGVLQLQGGTHHSFVVEQAGGLVLVDAPLYQDRGEALLQFLAQTFPGKSVRYVVASHFHEDHVAGIREVLGASPGASLIVHQASRDFWQGVLSAPSTLMPDSLARQPRSVEILTVSEDGSLRLEDPAHPVSLYDLDTEHAADMLLAREESSNTLFVVDIYSPGNGAPQDGAAVNAAIVGNNIPTANLRLVGGHGTAIDTYATLQSFLTSP